MNDFMADIDWLSILLDRQFNDSNGAVDSGAKAAWCRDEKVEWGLVALHFKNGSTRLLAATKAASYTEGRFHPDVEEKPVSVCKPLAALSLLILPLAGCSKEGEFDSTGGINITRSSCPAVAVPTYTGDITLFNPPASRDSRAIDVVANLTNLKSTCADQGEDMVTNATFDIFARRASATGPREISLPYFATVVQGGRIVVSKRIGTAVIRFADGALRGAGTGTASSTINRAAATLPADVQEKITRRRKAGDVDAALDPMADPEVKAAVARASFELLIGFQLSSDQLQYNATR
jgi:hypothetical protein